MCGHQEFFQNFPNLDKIWCVTSLELVSAMLPSAQNRGEKQLSLVWGHLSGRGDLNASLLQRTPDSEPDISVLCLERRRVLGKKMVLCYFLC